MCIGSIINDTVKQAYNLPEYKRFKRLLIESIANMKANDSDEVFHYPVTDKKAPGYTDVIKKPICLKDMRDKVRNCNYHTIKEFKKDVSVSMYS